MAVEFHNLHPFSPQKLVQNRYPSLSLSPSPSVCTFWFCSILMCERLNGSVEIGSEILNSGEEKMNLYNTQMGYSLPLSETTTETMIPAYNSWVVDSLPGKSESCLNPNLPGKRKLTRDSLPSFLSCNSIVPQPRHNSTCFSFIGEDLSPAIRQQQLEVDRVIAHHVAKVRLEVEENRKRQAKRILEAVEYGVMKKLKSKDEEIEKIGKLNWALEERVKSLCVENQIWRDLAQTNEAAAHALRSNLEQVLAQGKAECRQGVGFAEETPAAALEDDAQSCCGSNEGEAEARCDSDEARISRPRPSPSPSPSPSRLLCRNCGQSECCVLLLPCRHLCLCTACESALHTCPICNSVQTATVRVHMA